MLGLKEGQRSLFEESVHLRLSPDAPRNCHGDCRLESSPAVSRLSLSAEQRTSKGYIICSLHTWESPSTKVLLISSQGECNTFLFL